MVFFKKISLIICAFIILSTAGLQAQNNSLRFSHLSIEEGLSQSTVNSILQDSRGFLWIATEDGLNRYDGYNFTVFRNNSGDENSISGNSVNDLIEDANGNIWIATNGEGLNRFERSKESFVRYSQSDSTKISLNSNFITSLFEDRSGVLLIGTQQGLNLFDLNKEEFIQPNISGELHEDLKNGWITSIIEDHEGIIWIGTQSRGLLRYDRINNTLEGFNNHNLSENSISDNWITVIHEDNENRLWVGTQGGGINRYDRETNSFVRYQTRFSQEGSQSSRWILTMYQDRFGAFWVGTMTSLHLFDPENDEFKDLTSMQNAPDLSNNSVTSLFEDRSGVFWIGTKDDGLYKFVRSMQYFQVYQEQPGSKTNISNNNVWALCESHNGDLWIGTHGGGLNKINRERDELVVFRNQPDDTTSLSDNFINSIFEDSEGTLWVGTLNGLNKYIPEKNSFKKFKHDPDDPESIGGNIITTIREDRNGNLWVGTLNNGLSLFDKETETFRNYKSNTSDPESLSHNKVWSLYEDQEGVFWVGTHGFGLNKYDRENDVFKHFVKDGDDEDSISSNFVNIVFQDSKGRHWIGTLNGLNRYIPGEDKFISYSTSEGLPSNVIYGIIEDANGHLWLSTNNGISDFNPETETFRNYDADDGLPSDEFRFGAYHKSKEGRMFFGGINGVVSFRPDSLRDNTHEPPVAVTNFEVFNQPVSIGENSLLKESILETDSIALSYTHDVFSFEFSALHYAAPSQNKYAYKLEGFDNDWQYIDSRRFTSFTTLPPGEYSFKVKAANKDGIWNEEGTSISLSIAPPFWDTTWAYGFYILFSIGMVAGFVEYQTRKHERKKRQLEAQNLKLEKLVDERTYQLQLEKDKSDRLLYNILPKEVAEELKELGKTSPQKFEDATILFTDFEGFTNTATSMSAGQLVQELNEIFQQFDDIIQKNGIEKIKTIGDAYMAAGGLPTQNKNHALNCVEAACDMLRYIEQKNCKSSIKWNMRVGIHTGSVIAGVVGRKKFTYDLWGDTVIVASRMEEAGVTGKVNISSTTYNLVKDHFDCKYRGKVCVDGKGELDMYFISEEIKYSKAEI